MQLSSSENFPGIWALGGVYPQGHVADEFLIEPALHESRRQSVTVTTRKWRRVDADRHRKRRFVDDDRWQRLRRLRVGKRFANRDRIDARDSHEITSASRLDTHPLKVTSKKELTHSGTLHGSVGATPCNRLTTPNLTFDNSAQCETSEVGVRVKIGHPRLQWSAVGVARSGNRLEDDLKQRHQIGTCHI